METSAKKQKKDHKTFMQRRDLALIDILLSIEGSYRHEVIILEDPKSAWDKLQEMVKGISDGCIDTYSVKLQNLKKGLN